MTVVMIDRYLWISMARNNYKSTKTKLLLQLEFLAQNLLYLINGDPVKAPRAEFKERWAPLALISRECYGWELHVTNRRVKTSATKPCPLTSII
jgi:hypothetical protein